MTAPAKSTRREERLKAKLPSQEMAWKVRDTVPSLGKWTPTRTKSRRSTVSARAPAARPSISGGKRAGHWSVSRKPQGRVPLRTACIA